MTVELNGAEIATLLESVNYSLDRIRNAPDTPYSVRRDNLARLEAVAAKLRQARSPR
jgi:hypothetical protein